MSSKDEPGVSRRDLLKWSAMAGAGALVNVGWIPQARAEGVGRGLMIGVPFQPTDTVRLAVIGTGDRGTLLLHHFLGVEKVQVTAVCDVVREKALGARAIVQAAGQKAPAVYADGEHDFEKLVQRDDIDLVLVATPWDWHVPMALAAMKHGKHTAVEVPAATTIEDCWRLVECSERTRRHCIMLENCCYGYNELMVLNMVRAGLFGDLVHGEGYYIHDLREILFSRRGEGLWRRAAHLNRNGNLYPTHGLGPIANYMNINRGDRFDTLVSMSSRQRGLEAYRTANVAASDPRAAEKYSCGDMNVSLIRTANGLTIVLQHDVVNPRPYDRGNVISGTKGVFTDFPPRIYFDGQDGGEAFAEIDKYKAAYEHPLWKEVGELARKHGGHGGMDYIMVYRLIQCMRHGLVPDMDVHDAAALSAPGPLSEASVAHGSAPQRFPDFTGGHWNEKRTNIASVSNDEIPA